MNSSSFINFRKKLQLRVKPLPCDVNFFSSLLTNINLNETYKNFIQKPFVLFISVYNTHVVTATTQKYFKEKVVFISFVMNIQLCHEFPSESYTTLMAEGPTTLSLLLCPKSSFHRTRLLYPFFVSV